MDQMRWLQIINPFVLLFVCVQVITGLLMLAEIDEVLTVHIINGLLFAVLATVHILLNGPWIRASYFRKRIVDASHKEGL